jgi:hypothetical protein
MFTYNSKLTVPPLQSLTQYKIRAYWENYMTQIIAFLAHNLEFITAKVGGIYNKNLNKFSLKLPAYTLFT